MLHSPTCSCCRRCPQVATVLAKMELVGVGVDPGHLLGHRAALQQRIAAITARAAELAGGPFNLASASQLSRVLYDVLKLPPPTGGGGWLREGRLVHPMQLVDGAFGRVGHLLPLCTLAKVVWQRLRCQ